MNKRNQNRGEKVSKGFTCLLAGIVLLLSACMGEQNTTAEWPKQDSSAEASVFATTEVGLASVTDTELPAQNSTAVIPPSENWSFQFKFDNRPAGRFLDFVETDEAYIGVAADCFLHYWDKKSKEEGILCSRPECMHSDKNCNAYAAQIYWGSLSCTNDRLYWVGYSEDTKKLGVWSMNPDSTGREKLLDLAEVDNPENPQFYYFCGNECFEVCESGKLTDEKGNVLPQEELILYAYPLSGPEKGSKKEILRKRYDRTADIEVRFRNDWAYILLVSGDSGSSDAELVRWHVSDGQMETLLDRTDTGAVRFREFCVSPKGNLYLAAVDVNRSKTVYTVEDGELKEAFALLQEDSKIVGACYLTEGYAVVAEAVPTADAPGEYEYAVRMMDYNGKDVYAGKLPMTYMNSYPGEHRFGGIRAIFGDAERTFLVYEAVLDDQPRIIVSCFTVSEGTLSEMTLWTEVAE